MQTSKAQKNNQEKNLEKKRPSNAAPHLRFPEFSDDWEEKKLGEVSKFWNGKAHEQNISESGYTVVNSKFISTNGRIKKYSKKQISKLEKDDIVIVMSDIPNGKALAKTFLIDQNDKYTLNQRIGGINSKKVISSFLNRFLDRNKYYLKFDNKVTQTNLRKDEVLKCPIIFPSLPEQQKVASFLSEIDNWVENLKGQKKELENYKKAVMQKIFPAGDQKIPTLRFPNFTENWEEKKLGEVATFSKGKNLPKSDIVENGKNECIHYGELFKKYDEKINDILSKTNIKQEKSFLSEKNDILMPTSDVTPNGLATASALSKENIILGGDILVIRNKEILNIFFSYWVKQNRKKIMRLVSGITVYHLYGSDMSKLKIKIPKKKEQQKIASFLTSIDGIIKSTEKKISEAEKWKKGLMQKMFV